MPKESDVDDALLEWFKQQGIENVPVSNALILITIFFLNVRLMLMYY
jgi:hypothetical protein